MVNTFPLVEWALRSPPALSSLGLKASLRKWISVKIFHDTGPILQTFRPTAQTKRAAACIRWTSHRFSHEQLGAGQRVLVVSAHLQRSVFKASLIHSQSYERASELKLKNTHFYTIYLRNNGEKTAISISLGSDENATVLFSKIDGEIDGKNGPLHRLERELLILLCRLLMAFLIPQHDPCGQKKTRWGLPTGTLR